MILIADSGSTKTAWCSIHTNGDQFHYESTGINPYHQSEQTIKEQLNNELLPQLGGDVPEQIFFYGAGCGVPEKQNIVKNCFTSFWPNVESQVSSDLLGAARSLLQGERGIACILGTGSNTGLYNGEDIIANVSAGGYILGDEGSGAVLGKLFASDYIKNQLSPSIRQEFEATYNVTPAEIIDKVYRQPNANRYLAQFTRFMSEHLDEPCIYNLIFDSFDSFVVRNLIQYPDYEKLPIGFVGSIAYYFHDVLEVVLLEHQLNLGDIVKSPLDGMVKYHLDRMSK